MTISSPAGRLLKGLSGVKTLRLPARVGRGFVTNGFPWQRALPRLAAGPGAA
jgi:hypothetical protein